MTAPALATDLALACDPHAFAAACGFPDLYPWQAEALTSTARRELWALTRQGGKSSTASLLAVKTMLDAPGALCVSAAHRLPSCAELVRKVKHAYSTLAQTMPLPPLVGDAATSLELASGSRFIAVPGSDAGARSWSAPRLLILDEAARIPGDACDALLASQAAAGPDARVLALSTPRGQVDVDTGLANWFYAQWSAPADAWQRRKVTAHEIPSIDPAWLEAERLRIGEMMFAAEFLVDFTAGTGVEGALDPELLQRALTDDVAPLAIPALRARTLPPTAKPTIAEALA